MFYMVLERSDFYKISEENAIAIAKWLVENHAGESITKVDIQIEFKLPHNQLSLVFGLLKRYGFLVSRSFVVVPLPETHTSPSNSS